jgi:hypothetical protein
MLSGILYRLVSRSRKLTSPRIPRTEAPDQKRASALRVPRTRRAVKLMRLDEAVQTLDAADINRQMMRASCGAAIKDR